MKTLFKVLFVLLLILAAGVAVFIVTFDADRYRANLTEQMTALLQRPVRLEKLSLAWRGGIALELKGLSIYPDLKAKEEPSLEVARVSALLDPLPLVRRKFQIASVTLIQPRLHLVRASDGSFELYGVPLPKPKGGASTVSPSPVVAAAPFFVGRAEIQGGVLRIGNLPIRPTGELVLRAAEVKLRNVSATEPIDFQIRAALAGEEPNFSLSGTVGPLAEKPALKFKMGLDRLDLKPLFSGARPEDPSFQGFLSMKAEGTAQGDSIARWLPNLTTEGDLSVSEGVMVNLNILSEAFRRVTVVPGLMEILLSQLPEAYREQFLRKDTVLKAAELQFQMRQGKFLVDPFRVEADSATLTGSAQADLQGKVDAKAVLRVDSKLSAAMVGSVKELQGLVNSEGQLEFPVLVQGKFPKLTVVPDLGYLTSRLIASQAEELIGELLEKVFE